MVPHPDRAYSLLDLPLEILDLITLTIYQDGSESACSLKPLSCTCKNLRRVVIPLLFQTRTALCLRTASQQDDSLYYTDAAMMCHAVHISELRVVAKRSSTRIRERTYYNLHKFLDVVKRMTKLRTIRFEASYVLCAAIVGVLTHQKLDIIFDSRFITDLAWHTPLRCDKWTWSLALCDDLDYWRTASWIPRVKFKALNLVSPLPGKASDYVQLLSSLRGSRLLEELHLSETVPDNGPWSHLQSHAQQCSLLVITLPSLRRLRVGGSQLTKEILERVSSITTLEDLSIYSGYRAAFHPACSDDSLVPNNTEEMPWIRLPILRSLDIRFICRHFTIQQLVPPGLRALRIEFYGANEHLKPEELTWLAQKCPQMERLELDIGEMNTIGSTEDGPPVNTEFSRNFACLQSFRRLRVLRLLPSYWNEGHLRPHPLPRPSWSVAFFRRLQLLCPCLRTLIICISFGEYPFDVIERMSIESRPIKFVIKSFGVHDELVARYGHANIAEMIQMVYRAGRPIDCPSIVSVPQTSYFDDLGEDWIIPHQETRASKSWSYHDHQDVGLSLIDDLEHAQRQIEKAL